MTTLDPVRVGVLSVTRIAELAIVTPACATGTRLVTIAARDRRRAEAFAATHGVERTVGSYTEELADPEVELVYNPLPNGLHGPWNRAAIGAGKHVLSEKPFASPAQEAAEVRDGAQAAGVTAVEGFHYLFHPLMRRLFALLAAGEPGELTRVDALMAMPAPDTGDPRCSLRLAGGAVMDLGCYGLHAHRMLGRWAGGEPVVLGARAKERATAPGVDEWLAAELEFPSGATGTVRCIMAHPRFEMTLTVIGPRGSATVMDFVQPRKDDRVLISTPTYTHTEHHGTRSSYIYQLEALIGALRGGPAMPIDTDDAVATAALIDRCYQAAGLPLRPRTTLTPTATDHDPRTKGPGAASWRTRRPARPARGLRDRRHGIAQQSPRGGSTRYARGNLRRKTAPRADQRPRQRPLSSMSTRDRWPLSATTPRSPTHFGLAIGGRLAYWMWCFIHLLYLVDCGNRLRTLYMWSPGLIFTKSRGHRLIAYDTANRELSSERRLSAAILPPQSNGTTPNSTRTTSTPTR